MKNAIAALMARYSEVQLATLIDAVPSGSNWIHEIKLDGYRLLGFRGGSSAQLITRNGKNWTESFPSLSAALLGLAVHDAVLDMEAVVVDSHGKSSFQSLQNALGEGGDRRSIVAYVFDLLHLEGRDLTKLPLLERKEKLEALLGKSKTLRYSGHIIGQGQEMFVKACEAGLEGIVSKDANAPYLAGRGKSWLKIKCSLRQEFIIVGYSDPQSGARALGALYLAYRQNGALRYAGKVGTGFTMKSAAALSEQLGKLSVETPVLARTETARLGRGEWQRVHWVRPTLLCEVSFTEWTGDGLIRHPSFQGLRKDKNASQVSKETPVGISD
jgi:bifunctional non-homologous end joining protein LigD